MKLVTFEITDNRHRLGALYKEETMIADLALAYDAMTGERSSHLDSLQNLIEGGESALGIASQALQYAIDKAPEGGCLEKNKVKLLAPLPCPVQMRDFLCFKEHLLNSQATTRMMVGQTEGEGSITDPSTLMIKTMSQIPIYYKCNRFSVIGPEADIIWPDYSSLLDYEMEFAAVIGKKAKDILPEKARDYIFGYTIFNDMSARDYQMMEMAGLLGPGKGKDFDTGTVIGPCIVTADEMNPDHAAMIVRINGVEVSRGNSSEMYHKFEDCIAHVTRCETLYPGELIASGTVGMGSGFERFSFLAPGDVIELEVKGIGVLKNRVIAGPERKNPNPIKTDPAVKGKWDDVAIKKWPFEKGLHKITNGIYAWIAPDGSWMLSNAGLVVDGNQSLLIDTLCDLKMTAEMLEIMKKAEPEAASQINTLVNTHGDGDHWFGNELLKEAEIIASAKAAAQMQALGPPMMSLFVNLLSKAPTALGRMINKHFGRFEFAGIMPAFPTKLVDDKMTLEIGRKKVELIVVGPAHTPGDMLVYLPEERVLFAGDIVFAIGTPVVHAGPIGRFIDILKTILEMDVEVIVPGHGPITDKRAASAMIAYLEYVREEANKRFEAGMSILKTTRDIDLKEFKGWNDADRLVLNVISAYKDYSKDSGEGLPTEKFFSLSEVGDY